MFLASKANSFCVELEDWNVLQPAHMLKALNTGKTVDRARLLVLLVVVQLEARSVDPLAELLNTPLLTRS